MSRLVRIEARLSGRGDAAFEEELKARVSEIGLTIERALPPAALRAVLLIGGYGRGEGGVVVEDGRARPHNNLDFLVVVPAAWHPVRRRLARRLDEAVRPIAQKSGIGVDVGLVSELTLRTAPRRVMWCDVRLGHRLVVGEPAAVERLFSRFVSPDDDDVENLLVNRASLLVLNDLLLEEKAPTEAQARAVVRHAHKAVVGYGDALLAAAGLYHPSYLEKRARMETAPGVPAALRDAYDRAIEFRLSPVYPTLTPAGLRAEALALRAMLAPVHLSLERSRLGACRVGWGEIFEARRGLFRARTLVSPRRWLEAARAAGVARDLLGGREILRLTLPAALFPEARAAAPLAREALGVAPVAGDAVVRRAYLARFARFGDDHFEAALGALGVSIGGSA